MVTVILILLIFLGILLLIAAKSHDLRLQKIGKIGLAIILSFMLLTIIFLRFHFGAEE